MSPNETEQSPLTPPQPQQQQVMHMNPRIEKDRQLILDAQRKGKGALFKVYVKLSGPGWLQSGITLGGGSLSSSFGMKISPKRYDRWNSPNVS